MKLFFILGNQLFPLKYLDRFKKDHMFFMAEDNGLCTYEKHHKQKILAIPIFYAFLCRQFKEK
jgi:deoxyribodipyrimidine photolyase-related protein